MSEMTSIPSKDVPGADRDRNRRAILAAATTLFAQRGFRPTTMQSIARHAGVSVGYLYKHFAGKDAIFAAILESHLARLDEMSAEVEARQLPPLEELRAVYDAVCRHFNAHREFMRIYHDNLDDAVQRSQADEHGHRRRLVHLLERARDRGDIRGVDCGLVAAAIEGASRELFLALAERPGENPFGAFPDLLFALLIDPLRT